VNEIEKPFSHSLVLFWRISVIIGCFFGTISLTNCCAILNIQCRQPNSLGRSVAATFQPTSVAYRSGSIVTSDAHSTHVDVEVPAGTLEAALVTLHYPGDFAFHGFPQFMGNMRISGGGFDTFRFAYSIDSETGFVDINDNNEYEPASEPFIQYSTESNGDHTLTMILPFGGDGNPNTKEAPIPVQFQLNLYPGSFTNPSTPGDYAIQTDLLSIDPDSGGLDDGVGDPPMGFQHIETLSITDCATANLDVVNDLALNVMDLCLMVNNLDPDLNQGIANWPTLCP